MHTRHMRIAGAALLILLTGCAATVGENIKASAENVARYKELSAVDVVAALEKNVEEAKRADMPFLAPHYYNEAARILAECQGGLTSKPREALVNSAAKGDAVLEKGRAMMTVIQYRFSKELEYRAQLLEHNAPQTLLRDYDKVMAGLARLIEKVELEKSDNIDKEKEEQQKEMLDLVIRAVQEGALHDSEVVNNESRKKIADKQVPLTFGEAVRVFDDAKRQIAAAHHDRELVKRLGAQALFAARHAQQINDRVALLLLQLRPATGAGMAMRAAGGATSQLAVQIGGKPAQMDNVSVEMVVLQEENRLLAIATALGLGDLRDQPLEKQAEEIKRAAVEMARMSNGGQHPAERAAIDDMEARLKTASDANNQAHAELAAKGLQVEALTAQLNERDAQIKTLKEIIAQLEGKKKAPASSKPAKAKPAQGKKK